MVSFKADGHPLLIGSIPMDDHEQATRLVLDHTAKIPLWVQLPCYRDEGMIRQFMPGLPGFTESSEKNMLDSSSDDFDQEYLTFFEDFLAASESGENLTDTRFAFNETSGKGFFEFLRQVDENPDIFLALKGQVTGPISFGTAVKDENNKDIFYHDQLKDAAVKKLAMNAKWQAQEYRKRNKLPIIFLDEPALTGFGTSAYITITKEDVIDSLEEIIAEIHAQDGLAGIHVCGNTEWGMLLSSNVDIISFDAFSYFDRFILYPDLLKTYLEKGKLLAFGIVPTHKADVVNEQTAEGLADMLSDQFSRLSEITKITPDQILSQSFVTPSCGTGSLDLASARKVLALTKAVSEIVRQA
jgi:hypothetical protein